MIKENELYDWDNDLPRGVRLGYRITLDSLEDFFKNNLVNLGFPLEFSRDEIRYGSIFNRQYEECLVMKNADHPRDYFHFTFTVHDVGNGTTVSFYRTGYSTRNAQAYEKERYQNSDSLFENILGAFSKTDTKGLQDETIYYSAMTDAINQIFD